jgi:hypothetical protein
MATIVFRIALHSILSPAEYNTFSVGLFGGSSIFRDKLTVSRQSRDK